MVGEIGVFSPHKIRIATAVAVTRVEVLALAEDRVIALYTDNREFGFYLVSLITKRLVANFEELERQVAATRSGITDPASLTNCRRPSALPR